jgi:hypothetical protein
MASVFKKRTHRRKNWTEMALPFETGFTLVEFVYRRQFPETDKKVESSVAKRVA